MTKHEVIKATGAIQISHTITLVQQQLWNFLLAHAYPDFDKKDEYTISISKIMAYLANSRNEEHIKESLKGLAIRVEYNILGKDNKERWGIFHLLESVEIHNGACTYSYSARLKELLNNPTVFAKISLLVQKKFDCKYALFLYELAVDYKSVGQTPWLKIAKFRQYMGLEEHEYPSFSLLSFHVIKKAIKEINKKSDLIIEPEYGRVGRTVTALKFSIKQSVTSAKKSDVPQLSFSEDQVLLEKLCIYGLSRKWAQYFLGAYSHDRISEKIKLLESNKDSIRNTGAWLMSAIEHDWTQNIFKPDVQKTGFKKTELFPTKEIKNNNNQKDRIESLKTKHDQYIELKSKHILSTLTESQRSELESHYHRWLKEKQEQTGKIIPETLYRKFFLIEALIEKKEQDFCSWANACGIIVEKIGKEYRIIE